MPTLSLTKRGPAIVYYFAPRPDITVFELAQLISVLVKADAEAIDALPPECRRHFKEVVDG